MNQLTHIMDTDTTSSTTPLQIIENEQQFYVYLLESSSRRATYVGATTNLDRRLRQHNKEITGGATATGMRVSRGETWSRICHVSGFPTWNAALQFEWRFKQITRRLPPGGSSVERRKRALEILLALDRPTTKAMAYAEWPNGTGPVVKWS
jgi:structure-specific endonuclease subunit SLX1